MQPQQDSKGFVSEAAGSGENSDLNERYQSGMKDLESELPSYNASLPMPHAINTEFKATKNINSR